MKLRYRFTLALLFSLCLSFSGWSQCKSFTKKKCLPNLAPYLHNGQLNSAVLFQGENATLMMTFYSGQDYRIIVCHHKILEGTYFRVTDTDDNLIYSSKDKDSNSWDFAVNSTQQLLIQVFVPEAQLMPDMVQNGCISVLVGFKE